MQGEEQFLSPGTILHVGELIILLCGAWLGLKIKDAVSGVSREQDRVKADLIHGQNEMQLSMNEKHSENKRALNVHMAEDRTIFEGLKEYLKRIEAKLDKYNGK